MVDEESPWKRIWETELALGILAGMQKKPMFLGIADHNVDRVGNRVNRDRARNRAGRKSRAINRKRAKR